MSNSVTKTLDLPATNDEIVAWAQTMPTGTTVRARTSPGDRPWESESSHLTATYRENP